MNTPSTMSPTTPSVVIPILIVVLLITITAVTYTFRISMKQTQQDTSQDTMKSDPSSSPVATPSTHSTPRAVVSPQGSTLPNMRFHEVICTYSLPASAGAPARVVKLTPGTSFKYGAYTPPAISCNIVFENTSLVSTGEVFYTAELPGMRAKTTSIGVQGQGLYPRLALPGEEQQYITEYFTLPRSVGTYTIRFTINPGTTVKESTTSDNTFKITYSITP